MAREIEYGSGGLVRGFRLLGFATGSYTCTCGSCGERFLGDKRSQCCLGCAIKLVEEKFTSTNNRSDEIALTIEKTSSKVSACANPTIWWVADELNAVVAQLRAMR